jgi:predicted P-loop ATPase
MTDSSENSNAAAEVSLLKFWEQEVLPRLTADLVYDHPSHQFQRSAQKWRGGSPFRKSKSGTSFAVWPDTLRFYDAGCEFAGDPIAYIHSIKANRWEHPKGIDWVEALREAASRVGVALPERDRSPREIEVAAKWEMRRGILAAVYAQCRDWLWSEAGTAALNHLIAERGMSRETIAELGLGYYHSQDEVAAKLKEHNHNLEIAEEVGVLTRKWEGYVTFPWHTALGQPLTVYGHCPTKPLPLKKDRRGWKSERDAAYRAWSKLSEAQKIEQPWVEPTIPKKYACWNPKDGEGVWLATKESPLYFDRALAASRKEVVVVEGVTDAAVAQALGDTRVVACVAASLSGEQVQSLRRSGIERVIICLDPDSAGDKGIESCIKSLLAAGIVPYVAPRLPVGADGDGDPDKFIVRYGIDAWLSHTSLEKAQHGLRWKARQITSSAGKTDANKQAALFEATKWATTIKDAVALDIFFWPAIGEALGSSPPLWLTKFGKELSESNQRNWGCDTKPLSSSENTALDANDAEIDSKMLRDYRKLLSVFGNRIRLNTLTKRIEIDGQPLSLDRAKLQLAIKYGIVLKSGREDVQDMVAELAESNQYSPIAEYLLSLPVPADTSILDSLAKTYLGACEPIYSSMVRKTLIAAAARALKPGCKVDTALILQSPQGWKKSQFFKVLAGDWFDDSFGAMSDKDERLKLHSAWILEWAELETVFKRKDVAATKAFLSCASDSIRPPYGRETVKMARPSLVVGSTNETEFLSDTTGNRRFWVVPVKQRIDIERLKVERDAIWAAATLAYHSGEHWWLDPNEERTASALAEEFQAQDPWHDPIADFVDRKEWVAVTSVLNYLQLDLNRQERAHQMRVAGVLKLLGWSKTLRTVDGKRVRVWVRPMPPDEPNQNPEPGPEDLPPDLPIQPQFQVDRKVDRFQILTASGVSNTDTTCNNLLIKKEQKLRDESRTDGEKNISLRNGENRRSGSSGSSNLDTAGHDSEPPILESRSDLSEGRSPVSSEGGSCSATGSLQGSSEGRSLTPAEGRSLTPAEGRSLTSAEGRSLELSEGRSPELSEDRSLELSEGRSPEFPEGRSLSAATPEEPRYTDSIVVELVEFVRAVVQSEDPAVAKDIQGVLKEVCDSGAADRKEVWSRLSPSERAALLALLQPQPVLPSEAVNAEPKQLNLLRDFSPLSGSENRFSPESEDWF